MTTQQLLGEVAMTNDEYHAAPGISCSQVKAMADGDLEYFDKYVREPAAVADDDEEEPLTKAKLWKSEEDLVLGSAIHMAILEPDLVMTEIVQMPGLDFRTKNGRAERDAILEQHYPHKLVLSARMVKDMLLCRDAVYAHPFAKKLFGNGRAETTTFANDPETGALIKCRTDWENEQIGAVVDVKSTTDASPAGFAKQAHNLRYQFQPVHYLDVLEAHRGWVPENWIWLAIEKPTKTRRHARVGVYYQDPEDIRLDRPEVRHHFNRILSLRESGAWPQSYTDTEIERLSRPGWARRREF